MANKPLKLDLTGMKSASESSTPTDEYHTPPAEGFILSPNEAFSFPLSKNTNTSRFEKGDFRNMNIQSFTDENANVTQETKSSKLSEGSTTRRTFRLPSRHSPNSKTSLSMTANQTKNQTSNPNNLSRSHEQVSDSDLVGIRKRLEERRKRIETEKRRVEQQVTEQRQAVNKQVFHSLIKSAHKQNDENNNNLNKPSNTYNDNLNMNNKNKNPYTTTNLHIDHTDMNNNPNNNLTNGTVYRAVRGERARSSLSKSYYGQESADVLGKLFASERDAMKSNSNDNRDEDNNLVDNNLDNKFKDRQSQERLYGMPKKESSSENINFVNNSIKQQNEQRKQPSKPQLVRPSSRLQQTTKSTQQSPTTNQASSKIQSVTKQQTPTKSFSNKDSPTKPNNSPTKPHYSPQSQQHTPQKQQYSPPKQPNTSPKQLYTPQRQVPSRQQQSSLKQPTRNRQALPKQQQPFYSNNQQQQQFYSNNQQQQHISPKHQHSIAERRKWVKPLSLNPRHFKPASKSAKVSQLNAKSSERNAYGTSLERLNSSLTELQSEIMQLSLNQSSQPSSPLTTQHHNDTSNNDDIHAESVQQAEPEEEEENGDEILDDEEEVEFEEEEMREDDYGGNDGGYDDNDEEREEENNDVMLESGLEGISMDGYISSPSHPNRTNYNNQRNYNDTEATEASAFQRYTNNDRPQRNPHHKVHRHSDIFPSRSATNERFMTPQQANHYGEPIAYPPHPPHNDMAYHHPLSMLPPPAYPYYPMYTPQGYFPPYPYPPYNVYNHPSQNNHTTQPPYSSQFMSLDRRREGHKIKRDSSLGGFPRSPTRHHHSEARPRRESNSANRFSHPPRKSLPRPSSVMSDYFQSTEQDYQAFRQQRTSSSYPPLGFSMDFKNPKRHLYNSRHSLSTPGYYSPQQQIYNNLEATNNLATSFENEYSRNNSPQLQKQAAKACPQAEFFVVDLDGPKRPKPLIGSGRKVISSRNSKLDNCQSSETKSENKTHTASSNNINKKNKNNINDVNAIISNKTKSNKNINDNKNTKSIEANGEDKIEWVSNGSSSSPFMKTDEDASETGSVGFIIDHDTTNDPTLAAEAEKKRQRLQELHEKRKKEAESKRRVRTDQQVERQQELLAKEEESKQKKTEEKERREAIFKQYLQRKTAEQSDASLPDDTHDKHKKATKVAVKPAATTAMVNGRNKGKPVGRPRSQLIGGTNSLNTGGLRKNGSELNVGKGGMKSVTPDVTINPSEPFETSAKGSLTRFLSCGSEAGSDEQYAGPKLFVKPNQKSNRSIIINALKDCCLAGTVNKELKGKVIEEINKSESKHFVVMFRDAGLQYRALYSYNPDKNEVLKIHGVGPKQLLDQTMEKFYKYNSGCKNFSEVTSTKHLSSTIDGVTIPACMWVKKTVPVSPYHNGGGKR